MTTKRKPNRRRTPQRAREWEPLKRALRVEPTEAQRAALIEELRKGDPDADDATIDRLLKDELWMNDRYVVAVDRRGDGTVLSLSIRRADRKAVRDWRDFQRIKDELAGRDAEAVELFPCRARLVDTANQFWLWCLPPGVRFPVGFTGELVDGAPVPGSGAQQRPFPLGYPDPLPRAEGAPGEEQRDGGPVPPEADTTDRLVGFDGDPDDPTPVYEADAAREQADLDAEREWTLNTDPRHDDVTYPEEVLP